MHTFDTTYVLGNSSARKTQLEGEATLLSFFEWKYGCEYKQVWPMACGLLQCTNPLCVLYLISFLDIFA